MTTHIAAGQARLPLTAESVSYTLTLGGRYAGTQDWVIRPDKGSVVVRVQTDFAGALPAGRRIQESRLSPRTGFSLAYAEAEGSSKKPHFETVFDDRSGMVTLRQGKDEASLPLLEGHHDPLSLLLWLRGLHGIQSLSSVAEAASPSPDQDAADVAQEGEAEVLHGPTSVRMVGGRVHLQPLPDSEVQGQAAWVYFLRPGGAYVYVEQAPQHRLLRLIQPSDFGPVEALLTGESPASARPHRADAAQGNARPVRGQVGKPRRRR
jgi:hypothetical protein